VLKQPLLNHGAPDDAIDSMSTLKKSNEAILKFSQYDHQLLFGMDAC